MSGAEKYLEYVRDLFGDTVIMETVPLITFEQKIRTCTLCALSESRTNFVFGRGKTDADIIFVGEAPGEAEDLSGIPFVGRAGKLLDKMLEDINLKREDVFITNVLKCRPPNNRDPHPDEIALCENYLHEQIRLIRPRIIVALGRISGKLLTGQDLTMKEMRGRTFRYRDVDLRVVYHPAAILRNMGLLEEYRRDFRQIAQEYRLGQKEL